MYIVRECLNYARVFFYFGAEENKTQSHSGLGHIAG
jgi:hypothetical protein